MMQPILAYIDPGSGSLLLQLAMGCVLGTGLFFRQNLARIFSLFRRNG
jgi:hypothetical protein